RHLRRLAHELAVVAAFDEEPLGVRLLEERRPDLLRGMCEAIASTGTPLRWASYSPWIRWVFPGPQLPAQTASRPVRCASAAAAKAPASSLRTWIHSMPSGRRIASTKGFRLSPTTPYTRVTPAWTRTSTSCSATVLIADSSWDARHREETTRGGQHQGPG